MAQTDLLRVCIEDCVFEMSEIEQAVDFAPLPS